MSMSLKCSLLLKAIHDFPNVVQGIGVRGSAFPLMPRNLILEVAPFLLFGEFRQHADPDVFRNDDPVAVIRVGKRDDLRSGDNRKPLLQVLKVILQARPYHHRLRVKRTIRFLRAGNRIKPKYGKNPHFGRYFPSPVRPVRIRFTTTPCHLRPVRVGTPSVLSRSAIRSNPRPSTLNARMRSSAQRLRSAVVITERLPPLAVTFFSPLAHPRPPEVQYDLSLVVLGHGSHQLPHQNARPSRPRNLLKLPGSFR